MASRTSNTRRRGRCIAAFTLAESLMASVVLAVAVVGVSAAISASYLQTSVNREYLAATAMSRELMEEAAGKAFGDATIATVQPVVRSGASGNYSATVTVEYRSAPAGPQLAGGDFALITVRVTAPHGRVCRLDRLITRTTISL